jgi:2-iminobutanoate/2-iminopropanoate deaminase
MSTQRSVTTPKAPQAIGPYSQAVIGGGFVFASGQIALDPQSGELVGADVSTQTERVLENLAAVLEAAGSGFSQVVKTTVYLVSLADFQAMNQVYERYFGSSRPARATVGVAALPKGARVEIDAIALAGGTH